METKIVYVVYGSRTEISKFIAFLVSGEWAFNYSGEYLYFSNDPTELIKEAGMDLKAVTEHWCTNCFGFKDAPKEYNSSVERSEADFLLALLKEAPGRYYLKESLIKLLEIDRSDLPADKFVGIDFNIFKNF